MTEVEYAKFIVTDTARYLVQAVVVYTVVLGAYWTLVG